jgi:hypothetical protein
MNKQQTQKIKKSVSKLTTLKQTLSTDLKFWDEISCKQHLTEGFELSDEIQIVVDEMWANDDPLINKVVEARTMVDRLPIHGRLHKIDVELKIRDIQIAIDILRGLYSK